MVVDLGRDYYHLSGTELEQLGQKVRGGDMEPVLRLYENEMKASTCTGTKRSGLWADVLRAPSKTL
jgi:nuclear-control-of-ATPase protein 2